MGDPKTIRTQAGLSLDKAAAFAGVATATARVYELDPDAVKNPAKRGQLDRFYARLASAPDHGPRAA